jgi:hypothetical protein
MYLSGLVFHLEVVGPVAKGKSMGHGVDRVTLRFRSRLVCDPVWPDRASFALESDDDEARDSSVVWYICS